MTKRDEDRDRTTPVRNADESNELVKLAATIAIVAIVSMIVAAGLRMSN